MKELVGRVTHGFGVAGPSFAKAFEEIGRRLGSPLVPGTMNVVLRRPYRLRPDGVVIAADGNGYEDLHYVQCTVAAKKNPSDSVPALLVRTSTQADGRSEHGLEVIELAASIRLMDSLRLSFGERVVIAFARKESIVPVPRSSG
jgi:CTP-dependent riboflavin kinase